MTGVFRKEIQPVQPACFMGSVALTMEIKAPWAEAIGLDHVQASALSR